MGLFCRTKKREVQRLMQSWFTIMIYNNVVIYNNKITMGQKYLHLYMLQKEILKWVYNYTVMKNVIQSI